MRPFLRMLLSAAVVLLAGAAPLAQTAVDPSGHWEGMIQAPGTDVRIEMDLMKKTPRSDWAVLSHLLVAHGRAICIARSPRCGECVFKDICPSSTVRR